MAKKIKKDDPMYKDALSWMAYRYAIGITECVGRSGQSEAERYKMFRDIVFIRGNHDNPAYFNLQPIKHRRWMTLPDYSVIKTCGHTILCVGGATSIDRTYRMNSKNYHFQKADEPFAPNVYWPNERTVYDQNKLDAINEICAIDTVITHSSPSFCELSSHQGLHAWAIRDEDLLDDVKRERKVMDDILGYLYEKNHPLRYCSSQSEAAEPSDMFEGEILAIFQENAFKIQNN